MRKRFSPPHQHIHSDHEALIFSAELGEVPSLDLHGVDTINAKYELESFLHHHFMRRSPVVKIIHGRGTLRLRETVHRILGTHLLIDFFRDSTNPHETEAVTYAVLAKK